MMYTCTLASPLGNITAAAENDALVGLWFVGQKYYPPSTEAWAEQPDYAIFEALRAWFAEYFSGQKATTELPLAP